MRKEELGGAYAPNVIVPYHGLKVYIGLSYILIN